MTLNVARNTTVTGGVRYANFTVTAGLITDHLPVLERAIRDLYGFDYRIEGNEIFSKRALEQDDGRNQNGEEREYSDAKNFHQK